MNFPKFYFSRPFYEIKYWVEWKQPETIRKNSWKQTKYGDIIIVFFCCCKNVPIRFRIEPSSSILDDQGSLISTPKNCGNCLSHKQKVTIYTDGSSSMFIYLFIYVCQRLSAWKINSSKLVLNNSLCVCVCCHKLESNCHGWSISRL